MGILGLFNGTVSILLAAFVYATAPHRTQNRRLALVLSLESTGGLCGAGLLYLTDHAPTAFALQAIAYVTSVPIAMAYLNFLGSLPSPLTEPLRWRATRWVLLALSIAYMVFFLWRIDLFIAGVGPTPYSRFESIHGPLLFPLTVVPGIAAVLFGGLAALSMWWFAPQGTPQRRQGLAYLVAFGWRDATWLSMFVLFFWLEILTPTTVWGISVTLGIFPILLSYAVLKHQLFDIDLKIKWTIRRGTLAAIVVAGFLIVSQLVENLASDVLGLVAGSVTAGILLFLIQPLSRFADRVADRAMPHVRDDPEYRLVRKLEVYRATVEGAFVDGVLSDRERDMLARLQDQLGISGTEARMVEREITRVQGLT